MDLTGLGAVASTVETVINKIWPDKSEQEKREIALAMTVIQGQLQVNTAEAQSADRFIAGWRPFIGWVCGMACAWNWIGLSIANMIIGYTGTQVTVEPASLTEMLPILIGMLGLGAYRTTEKLKGKA